MCWCLLTRGSHNRYHPGRQLEHIAGHHQWARPATHWPTGRGRILTGHGDTLTGRGDTLTGRGDILTGHRYRQTIHNAGVATADGIATAATITTTTVDVIVVVVVIIITVVGIACAALNHRHARCWFASR